MVSSIVRPDTANTDIYVLAPGPAKSPSWRPILLWTSTATASSRLPSSLPSTTYAPANKQDSRNRTSPPTQVGAPFDLMGPTRPLAPGKIATAVMCPSSPSSASHLCLPQVPAQRTTEDSKCFPQALDNASIPSPQIGSPCPPPEPARYPQSVTIYSPALAFGNIRPMPTTSVLEGERVGIGTGQKISHAFL